MENNFDFESELKDVFQGKEVNVDLVLHRIDELEEMPRKEKIQRK